MTIVGHTSDSKTRAHMFASDDGIYCRACGLPRANGRHATLDQSAVYADCGTYRAYQRHMKKRTPACLACKRAQARHMREWRIARRKVHHRDTPVQLGYSLSNMGGGRYRIYSDTDELGSLGDVLKTETGWLSTPSDDHSYAWYAPTRRQVVSALVSYLEGRPIVWWE